MEYWIEKTYSSKRELNKDSQFKKVLLSPVKSINNSDIYANMRKVKINDVVLHLDQSVDAIIGFSKIASECEIIKRDNDEYYKVNLKNFIPYIPIINIREFFNDPTNYDILLNIKNNNKVFYQKHKDTFALRQGAYLTKIVPELYSVLTKYINRSKNTEVQNIREIPEKLLDLTNKKNDVSIIIGKNGTGKSQLLSDLVYEYLNKDKTTIAISSSIFDKFSDVKRNLNKEKNYKTNSVNRVDNYHHLGARNGPRIAEKTVENLILENKKNTIELFFKILKYIGYDQKLGLKFKNNSLNANQKNKMFESIDKNLLNDYNKIVNQDNILWIDGYEYNEFLEHFFNVRNNLQEGGFSISLDIFLTKGNIHIPLLQASSGELVIITTYMHISLYIDNNSVIVIDEPENSLHLYWQKNFIKILLDLFASFKPKIVIATHSPMLISISEILNPETMIYVVHESLFEPLTEAPGNYEMILLELFETITPENRSFSNELIELLNSLESGEISLKSFQSKIKKYEEIVYDNRQHKLLKEILDIGENIAK